MLKLFANQGKNTTVLLRACLPAVVSSNLCNARIVKNCRRNMSDKHDTEQDLNLSDGAKKVSIAVGNYHIWSMVSNAGHSLMKLKEIGKVGIECSGSFVDDSSVIEFKDSTVFPDNTRTLLLSSRSDTKYYLSKDGNRAVAKDETEGLTDSERLLVWRYYGYRMFESKDDRNKFLACTQGGNLMFLPLHKKIHPDPRTLFLIHSIDPEQD